MGYVEQKEIDSPEKILREIPLDLETEKTIVKHREEIVDIIEGKDDRKLLITGPCVAWPSEAVVEYAKWLKDIEENVQDKIKIVMRVYTQKPRTCLGWKGPLNQPNPFEKEDIEEGIKYCRKMMIDVARVGLPIADEALFTHNGGYFSDLLSYVAIGARSSEDSEHRCFASKYDIPVGLKNPTFGDMKTAINSVISAQKSHVFLYNLKQIKTSGNLYAHLILRGGNKRPNIDEKNIRFAKEILEKKVRYPSIVIDLSHDNSYNYETGQKDAFLQSRRMKEVLYLMKRGSGLEKVVKGFMVESFIKDGKQNIETNSEIDEGGLSCMDECIGYDKTKSLIMSLYKNI